MPRRQQLLTLDPATAAERIVAAVDEEWARHLVDELDRRVRGQPLERLMVLWDLSGAAAARVFGVSRQAFAKWLRQGPPPERAAQVADLAAATDVLDRYLRRDRIPAVVRRPAPALDGRSLLALAESGDSRGVLDAVRRMFDLRRVQP